MPLPLAILILAAVTVLIFVGMRRGWRTRERSVLIQDLPALPPGTTLEQTPGTSGIYVSTTLAGKPLERVVTLGLGTRSAVQVHVDPAGVLLARTGAQDLFIPAPALTGIRTTGGMIGKVAAADSIIVLTWSSDAIALDTGVHIRSDADRAHLLGALAALVPGTTPGATPGPTTGTDAA